MLNHKTIKTILTVTALCLISLARAEEKEGSKIELIPVYEKTFDDTIVDVIFDTATVSIKEAKKMGWKEEAFSKEERRKLQCSILYPKVIVIGKNERCVTELVFYSKKGDIKKKVPVTFAKEDILTSTNGKYILRAKRYDEFNEDWQGAVLYDWDGNVIWEKSEGIFTSVSDDGYTATGFVSPDGSFYPFVIYGPDGMRRDTLVVPFLYFNTGGSFSDGFYVLASSSPESTLLYIFSVADNQIKLKKEFPGYILHCDVSISSDVGIVVCAKAETSDQIIFLDWNGKVKWKLVPINLFLTGYVNYWYSEDGAKMFVYTTGGDFLIIHDGVIEKQFKIDKNLKRVKELFLKISANKIFLLSLQKEVKQ